VATWTITTTNQKKKLSWCIRNIVVSLGPASHSAIPEAKRTRVDPMRSGPRTRWRG
jgi:hypothetical protein